MVYFCQTLLFFIWLLLQPHSMGNDRLEILDSLSLVAQITWKNNQQIDHALSFWKG